MAVVDNTNKGVEAQYWIDDFLHVRQRKDEYFNTQQTLSLYKSFVKDELPQQFEVSKADQAALLNKSVQFFKEKDNFNLDEFANEVMQQPEVIESFNRYKSDCLCTFPFQMTLLESGFNLTTFALSLPALHGV